MERQPKREGAKPHGGDGSRRKGRQIQTEEISTRPANSVIVTTYSRRFKWLVEAMLYRRVPPISYDERGFCQYIIGSPRYIWRAFVASPPAYYASHAMCQEKSIDCVFAGASAIHDELWRHGCNHVAGRNARDAWNYTRDGGVRRQW